MNWDNLRYFIAVAREGSLSAAARILNVNSATIGRHIESLERQLSKRLFSRKKTGYTLTSFGEKLLSHAQAMEMEVFALNRKAVAEDEELTGTTTVTTTEALAGPFMVRNLARLRQRHPGITIQLIKDTRFLNLSRQEADLAIRLGRPARGDLKIRRIGTLGFGLYASAAYLKAAGTPEHVESLKGHKFIDWLDDYSHIAPCSWFGKIVDKNNIVLRTNSATERIAATENGLGITLAPSIMAHKPDLVRLLPGQDVPSLEIWLVIHSDLASVARIRAVGDFIAERAQIEKTRLLGLA